MSYLLLIITIWLLTIIVGITIWRSKNYNIFIAWFKDLIGLADHINNLKEAYARSFVSKYIKDVKLRYPHNLHWWEKIFAPLIINNVMGSTANLISAIRILLAIIILLILKIGQLTDQLTMMMIISLPIFIIGAILDLLDGVIARLLDQITDLGKYLDSLGDKILCASIILTMGDLYMLTTVFYLVCIQEGFLILIAISKMFIKRLPFEIATQSGKSGKWKAVFEFLGSGFLFLCPLNPGLWEIIANSLFIISIPLASGSIIRYLTSIKIKVRSI